MNIISSIINFLKSLFNSKTTSSDKAITQTTDRNKKYALIVGMETSAKFGGCPGADKDSNTMNALIGQYMDSTHIQRLNNAAATRAAVVSALNEQIAKVPADGLFVFTYSGHGGQTSWSSSAKNEIDGKDEFLCLNDGGLLDDDLWTIFNRCKGRIFVVFDCCHSGTMYRLANGEQTGECNGDDTEDNRIPLSTPFFSKYENVRAANTKMLVVSGCGEETVSWGDATNGGVLTSAMNRHFNANLNYREYWNKFRADSTFRSVRQVPICTRIAGFDLNAKIFN